MIDVSVLTLGKFNRATEAHLHCQLQVPPTQGQKQQKKSARFRALKEAVEALWMRISLQGEEEEESVQHDHLDGKDCTEEYLYWSRSLLIAKH